MQLSRLLHFRSSKEATGEIKKKKCSNFFFFKVLQCVKQEKKL